MKVTITAYRRGWFWPEPVQPGQVLEMPEDVAEYLIGVDAAVPAAETEDAPAAETEDAPAVKGRGKGKA